MFLLVCNAKKTHLGLFSTFFNWEENIYNCILSPFKSAILVAMFSFLKKVSSVFTFECVFEIQVFLSSIYVKRYNTHSLATLLVTTC